MQHKWKHWKCPCWFISTVPHVFTFAFNLCLQTPYCPPDTELLEEAVEVFRCFLTWPEPYSSVCRNLLSTLQLEIKAPGKYRLVCSQVAAVYAPVCLAVYAPVCSLFSLKPRNWPPPSGKSKSCTFKERAKRHFFAYTINITNISNDRKMTLGWTWHFILTWNYLEADKAPGFPKQKSGSHLHWI